MFGPLQYVPVLKWKLGEYQALARLSPEAKDKTTPLIEIPHVGYDFEKHMTAGSLDDHLRDFGKRLAGKWGARSCFVDLRLIPPAERMDDRSHPLARVLDLARTLGAQPTPVVALSSNGAFREATAVASSKDRSGAALRVLLEDFDRPNIVADIDLLLSQIQGSYADTDLIVDLGDKHFVPLGVSIETLVAVIRRLPALNRWRTFTMIGTSYPKTLAEIVSSKMLRRHEWELYRALVTAMGSEIRIPTFGDYAVAHPDPVELDMRMIKPFAKLRYTTPEEWYIGKGKAVRTSGFDQYRAMCQAVVDKPFYDGPDFSEGDRYIAGCAEGDEPTGNLTTWVWVSTNRHITRAIADLAKFHGA